MQRVRATALVVRSENILMMHRIKNGEEYWVLPGGGVEANENSKEAVLRELKEETNLTANKVKELFDFSDEVQRERIFLIEDAAGEEIKIGDGTNEQKSNNENNQFHLVWLPIKKIPFTIIYPNKTKQCLMEYFKLDNRKII